MAFTTTVFLYSEYHAFYVLVSFGSYLFFVFTLNYILRPASRIAVYFLKAVLGQYTADDITGVAFETMYH